MRLDSRPRPLRAAVDAPVVINLLLTPFVSDLKNSYDGRNQLTESAAVSTSIGWRDI